MVTCTATGYTVFLRRFKAPFFDGRQRWFLEFRMARFYDLGFLDVTLLVYDKIDGNKTDIAAAGKTRWNIGGDGANRNRRFGFLIRPER